MRTDGETNEATVLQYWFWTVDGDFGVARMIDLSCYAIAVKTIRKFLDSKKAITINALFLKASFNHEIKTQKKKKRTINCN